MGYDSLEVRRMMEESLGVIVDMPAMPGQSHARQTGSSLEDAVQQWRPWGDPVWTCGSARRLTVRASARWPVRDRHGLGGCQQPSRLRGTARCMVSIAEARAEQYSRSLDKWAIGYFIHVADTEREAREEAVRVGRVHSLPQRCFVLLGAAGSLLDDAIDYENENGMAVVGAPDRAIARIEEIQAQTGGFGTLLVLGQDSGQPGGHAQVLLGACRQGNPALQEPSGRPGRGLRQPSSKMPRNGGLSERGRRDREGPSSSTSRRVGTRGPLRAAVTCAGPDLLA